MYQKAKVTRSSATQSSENCWKRAGCGSEDVLGEGFWEK
jgi:hypothetical protein